MYFKHQHPRRGEIVEAEINGGIERGRIIWIYGDDQLYLLEFDDNRYYKNLRYDVIDRSKIRLLD